MGLCQKILVANQFAGFFTFDLFDLVLYVHFADNFYSCEYGCVVKVKHVKILDFYKIWFCFVYPNFQNSHFQIIIYSIQANNSSSLFARLLFCFHFFLLQGFENFHPKNTAYIRLKVKMYFEASQQFLELLITFDSAQLCTHLYNFNT